MKTISAEKGGMELGKSNPYGLLPKWEIGVKSLFSILLQNPYSQDFSKK